MQNPEKRRQKEISLNHHGPPVMQPGDTARVVPSQKPKMQDQHETFDTQ